MNTSSMLRRHWLAALCGGDDPSAQSGKGRRSESRGDQNHDTGQDEMGGRRQRRGHGVLLGDPAKTGLYVIMVRWHAHHMSRPHFHPHDRYITVLSGTWWVGTGTKFDPDSTVAMPTGSFVTHVAKQVHYDGAKDADTVMEIVGEGPETPTPAETH